MSESSREAAREPSRETSTQDRPEGFRRVAALLAERRHAHSPVYLEVAARTAQEAADALGIPVDRVDVRWGDTRLPKASGVYGSSHTMGIGSAVLHAAQDAHRKLAAFGARVEGPLDLAGIMTRAGIAEIVGEGSFAVPGGAQNFNGKGTSFAMQTFGVTMVEQGVSQLVSVDLRRAEALVA